MKVWATDGCNTMMMAYDEPVPDAQSVEQLYRRFVVMVRGCARRIVREPAQAEDIVQEVFIKFLKHRRAGGDERETAAFLYRMTTNLALNHLRNTRNRRKLLAAHWIHHQGYEDRAERRLLTHDLLAAVSKADATVALYYYVEGLGQREIAELLGMQRRTVGRRLQRFRKQALTWHKKAEASC